MPERPPATTSEADDAAAAGTTDPAADAARSAHPEQRHGVTAGRVAAGLAGAAVAAAVGAAAVAYVRNTARERGVRTYHVETHGDDWVVRAAGETSPSSAHATKSEALDAGRELARSNEPSRLVVHRADGSVMSTHSYGTDEPGAAG